jgi:hypothetical protein
MQIADNRDEIKILIHNHILLIRFHLFKWVIQKSIYDRISNLSAQYHMGPMRKQDSLAIGHIMMDHINVQWPEAGSSIPAARSTGLEE